MKQAYLASPFFNNKEVHVYDEVIRILKEKGYAVVNVDATVIAQKPKIGRFTRQMAENIAAACGVDADRINVKATTEENLGFTGRLEGISSHAVCLIETV